MIEDYEFKVRDKAQEVELELACSACREEKKVCLKIVSSVPSRGQGVTAKKPVLVRCRTGKFIQGISQRV